MPNKLKNLSVTSVDLVDKGANPDSYVCLFKHRDPPDTATKTDVKTKNESKKTLGFYNPEKEMLNTMTIDKTKMTPEEQATLEEFEKKYGTETNDIHPDVKKALEESNKIIKQKSDEVEELKKALEIEHLTSFAKKYEPLGKKPEELAEKLYNLKKIGGTVYDDFISILDENLTQVEKSRLFSEIGSGRQGTAGSEESISIKAAEIAKSGSSISNADAIVKAFEQNPELAAQYEKEYKSR